MKTTGATRTQWLFFHILRYTVKYIIEYLLVLAFYFLFLNQSTGQIVGCTDMQALNYNAQAAINDGSCFYASTAIDVLQSFPLTEDLIETSGLIFYDNMLWSHNDDTDTRLYKLDTTNGGELGYIELHNVVNTDWEEISQDTNYLYLGDFGNNQFGNRTDLHILRIKKSSIQQNDPQIDTIWFQYSNQTNFSPHEANTTDFDCEAMIVTEDSIYLFKKEWTSLKSTVYRLPKHPGNYIADSLFTLDVNGLITGATYYEEKKLIVLCGYTTALAPFLYLLYDYSDNRFLYGNKRRINVNLPIHQVEGIATNNGVTYFLTNEEFESNFITVPAQLHTLDLNLYLSNYLSDLNKVLQMKESNYQIRYDKHQLLIYNIHNHSDTYTLYNIMGEVLQTKTLSGNSIEKIDCNHMPDGFYFLKFSTGFTTQFLITN